jgi:hypothetical protein
MILKLDLGERPLGYFTDALDGVFAGAAPRVSSAVQWPTTPPVGGLF